MSDAVSQIHLRDYQERCISGIQAALAEDQSSLIEVATGLGKTVIGSAFVDRCT